MFDDFDIFWIVFSQAHFLQPFWLPHQPRWTCKRLSHFLDPRFSLYRFVWCFCCFCLCFWMGLVFLLHFHIFCRGVHFPFAHVFQFVVAAFRAQVVEAVKRQHTDSVHPRSIFRIFFDSRLSVAPLALFLLFFGCAGFSWLSMLLNCVFMFFHVFSICFP